MTTIDQPAAGRAPRLDPGRWVLDPGHTEVAFTGRHFGLTRIRGRFGEVQATLVVAGSLDDCRVDAEVVMASVSSGDRTRDDHLRSSDLFDVERHPTATFTATAVDVDGSRGTMAGDLAIAGVTRRVVFDVELRGLADDPWGARRAVFGASTTINREDFGLTWNMVLEAGGLLVSKEVRIDVEAEFVRQN